MVQVFTKGKVPEASKEIRMSVRELRLQFSLFYKPTKCTSFEGSAFFQEKEIVEGGTYDGRIRSVLEKKGQKKFLKR